MGDKGKILRFFMKKHKVKLSPTQIIAIAFAGIILLGTGLLMLPVSSRGEPVGFLDCLFTATSATCVTGLVRGDTGTMWTGFGQAVILVMIEIGGLGFMSAASMVAFVFRKKVGLRQRMIMAQALSLDDMESVVKIQKWVIFGSLAIQAVGALILTLRFLPHGFWTALKWGVFHSVSGFCNAGFDIFGFNDSVAHFNHDPVVMLTLCSLVIVSGLGFFVWEEMVRVRRFRRFSVYTRLVLITTAVLLLAGTGLILALEWSNPKTLGAMPWPQKLLNSLFQSVTLRTAGFASFSQDGLSDGGKAVSIILMLIGGSSGSTAGGIKTVTFVTLVLFVIARARGRDSVNVFHRRIPNHKVLDAMTIVAIMTGLAILGTVVICFSSEGVSFVNALYESASALATVGLTADTTMLLSVPAQWMIILFMYFGRVGVLTLSMGFLLGDRAEQRFSYAQTNLLIG